tara:strand:+ start:280 stop:507 length:228 start_codon:yes stop_codon:yes gene_type:complete
MTIFAIAIYDHQDERMALELHLGDPLGPNDTQPKCLQKHTLWPERVTGSGQLDADGVLWDYLGHAVLTCVWSALL